MHTPTLISKFRGLTSAVLLSSVFVVSAQAGPGLQYWQARAKNAADASPAGPSLASAVICAGSEMVPVTTMKPALPNGRGALVAVQTGTERVCHLCSLSTLTVTHAWPNHRGPQTTLETTNVGGAHRCTSGCTFSAKT
jgi:hypothetical protein